MKILFLTRQLGHGGAERQMVELAKGLQARGCQVSVAVFYLGGALDGELKSAGVPLHDLAKGGRWDVGGFLLRLIRLLRREAPDILHGYLPAANILTSLAKPFLPGVRIVWGVRASNMIPSYYDGFSRMLYRLEVLLAGTPNLVIANSEAGAEYILEKNFPAGRTIVIRNGIDTDRFRPHREAGRALRAEWGLDEKVKVVGLVGRLDPMKGHPTFFRAAALLAKRRDDLRFVCVGDGPEDYRRVLAGLVRDLGVENKVMWIPSQKNMTAVYNAFDLLCSSASFGEGFPNAVGEAMACGVPCVVTDVGDSGFIVGDSGIVAPPNDPEALARGCEKMLGRMETDDDSGGLARALVVKNFSHSLLIEKTERALRALMNESAP